MAIKNLNTALLPNPNKKVLNKYKGQFQDAVKILKAELSWAKKRYKEQKYETEKKEDFDFKSFGKDIGLLLAYAFYCISVNDILYPLSKHSTSLVKRCLKKSLEILDNIQETFLGLRNEIYNLINYLP